MLREVDEAVRQDEAAEFAKRHGKTIVAAVMVPLILLYQGWTYYVFRARVVGPSRTADDKVGNDVIGG